MQGPIPGAGGTNATAVQALIDTSVRGRAAPMSSFNAVDIGASTTKAANRQFSTSTELFFVPPKGGFIKGITCDVSGNASAVITAGSLTTRFSVSGIAMSAAGQVLAMGANPVPRNSKDRVTLPTPIWASARQRVTCDFVSSSLAPTTLDPHVDWDWAEGSITDAERASIPATTWDFDITFTAPWTMAAFADDVYLWRLDTPSGQCSIRLHQAGTATWDLILELNGADQGTLAGTASGPWQNWLSGDLVNIRCYITSTAAKIRQRVNSSFMVDGDLSFGAVTLVAPTGGEVITNGALVAYTDHTVMTLTERAAQHVILGDSTSGFARNVSVSVGSQVYTPAEALAGGKRIANLAHYGDTRAQCQAIWDASPYKALSTLLTVTLCIGINDLNASTTAAALDTAVRAQTAAIKVSNPNVKLILVAPFPADAILTAPKQAEWISFVGLIATDPSVDRFDIATSNSLNNNRSVGAAGVNLLDATGTVYDIGDGIHLTNLGVGIYAAALSAHYTALGLR